ncbi:hypothetical protein Tco_0468583 [Tanacetum coccineum]
MKTPMSSDTKLTKGEECESVDSTKYRGMIGTTHLGLWYPKGTGIEIVVYADSDHAGDYVDRKRTSGVCTFAGCCLTSWFSKKQTALAISTTEAEYVSVGKACQQALWMKQDLIDYDVTMPHKTSDDHKNTRSYIPKMSDEYNEPLKCIFKFFENRYIHEGRVVDPSFDNLVYISVPTDGPYQTDPPSPDDIKLIVQIERRDVVYRIRHEQEIVVEDNQIFTCEITDIMKTWVDIIQENVFCLGQNRDHVPACLCHMLFCIATSRQYNLAYFIAKRMKFVTKQDWLILPYGMLLTRLFEHVVSENPELSNHLYVLYGRVIYPLTAQQERITRKDYGTKRGRHSTSSASAFGQPSSSHLNDDDNDGNDEGTSRTSTPSPTRFVN